MFVDNGVIAVSEGANMPSTPEAIRIFQEAKILYAPGKAANAGGVSVSGLEMSQNSERISWSAEEVDNKLHYIMENIHENCVKYGTEEDGYVNYVKGANMPSTPEAIKVFQDAKILYAPGKAANAGGVSVSGLEMTQNSERISWSAEEVDAKLHYIMENIHENCVKYGTEPDGYVNYVKGANIAGFMKVANAMMAQGIV
jgi:glutamate dehydrogenase/leucine dehydrogenase